MCGGTSSTDMMPPAVHGLSPRVRGNPLLCHPWVPSDRSIPACAGEPGGTGCHGDASTVYPRVCGGTGVVHSREVAVVGLSPRVRGNPRLWHLWLRCLRSIPACAGEPVCDEGRPRFRPVYPRVCGGTGVCAGWKVRVLGLSPRVRGNRGYGLCLCRQQRSIPACAGEPWHRPPGRSQHRVYPRVCGGTEILALLDRAGCGLSPRVRGNLGQNGHGHMPEGSIPACAGEPHPAYPRPGISRVYPRVCGGTTRIPIPHAFVVGLSPRVRGNLPGTITVMSASRSIPACAGEPC